MRAENGGGTYQDTTMSYDGYGRLQSKHVPEQNASTATVYAYNANDTIYSVTDARGASATYGYNNRHAVTSINYSAPTGITATAPVSFAYDAAGNRTSMTDGLGSQSYNYNQLSQMTSETRTFNGVGSFTLGYDYNLAGELKKITDPTNMTINYAFDSSGRLSSVTGADSLFMGISNYASNFQYRAWGGLKAMSDGNNRTSSWLYNARLQPSHFEASGNLVSQNYDYYNDGRTKFVHNLTDTNFDRSYAYDHIARINGAATGGQARGDAGATPYNEGFGYDAFNNLNSRSTVSWGEDAMSDDAAYTNNRRAGWGYDANGNNTTIGSRSYQFDAAGQMTLMTGQQYAVNHYITITQASAYAGDGNKVKEVVGGQPTYYLRSSVINDAIVEEINGSGQKNVGYVYTPGGAVLAKQVTGQYGYLAWKYGTPAGTSEFETYNNSTSVSRTELDPLEASVPLEYTPPPTVHSEGDIGAGQVGGIMDRRWANFFDVTSGCSVEGVSASCRDAASALNNLGVMPPNLILVTIRIIYKDPDKKPRTIQFVTTSAVISSGINHTFTGDAAVEAARAWNKDLSGGVAKALDAAYFAGRVEEAKAQWIRRMTSEELAAFRSELEKALESDKCRSFIDKLISYNTGKEYSSQDHFLEYFDATAASAEGGFFFWSRLDGSNSRERGEQHWKISIPGKWSELNFLSNAAAIMHELIHTLTKGSDDQLDKDIRDLRITPIGKDGKALPFPTGFDKNGARVNDWSAYWDTALKSACFPTL
jgi:YD repeat-containing protein